MEELVLQDYDTNHTNRGTAVVILDKNNRRGCERDLAAVKHVLKELKFALRICIDYTIEKVRALLKEVATEDHTNSDCLLVVAMGHGGNGKLKIKNDDLHIEELWESFIGNKCPSLIGKPKLVFIQSCRGDKHDTGARLMQTDAAPSENQAVNVSVPIYADLLVMYSCYENYVSYRCEIEGSWFIQSLCKVLGSDIAKTELHSLLTHVAYLVMIRTGNSMKGGLKQMPAIHSMLSKRFYFVSK
ncbi:caspase-like [Anopheles maculipalpis]|uniref:caspase-like n=1 Tax=Anopheles maculipalpis TaxID=1496333 RepID=UPI002158FE1E|nr:caspase-like [Anopheles maculipalpis]